MELNPAQDLQFNLYLGNLPKKQRIHSLQFSNKISGLLLIVFFIVGSYCCQAQIPYTKFYGVQDGLIHPQITHLFKDSRGYLWIATKGGISKFNGRKFDNYYFNEIGLSSEIYNIIEDSEANIWATNKKGISIFNGSRWTPYLCPTPLRDFMCSALNHDSILYMDHLNDCWSFKKGQFKKLNLINQTGKLLRTVFFCNQSNSYYFNLNNSNEWAKLDGNRVIPFGNYKPHEICWHTSLQTYVKTTFIKDTAWVSNLNNVLLEKIPVRFNFGEVKITFNPDGNSILWNSLLGIYTKNRPLNSILNHQNHQTEISAFFADKQHYWLGTERGLIQLSKNLFEYFDQSQIPYPWGITGDQKGSIYIGDFLNGLIKIDSNDQLVPIDLSGRWYPHPTQDGEGHLYFNNEKQIYELRNSKLIPLVGLTENLNGFTASEYLHWSKQSKQLICAQRGGLSTYNPGTNELQKIVFEKELFKPHYVTSIQEFSNGELFAGSHAGLVKFNLQKNELEYFQSRTLDLPADGIICMKGYRDSILILGATNGLWFYDPNAKSCMRMLGNEIRNQVNTIEIFKDSLMIIGHLQGLTFFDLKTWLKGTSNYFTINQLNGFPGQMPRQNAAFIDSKGRYWFGAFDRLSRLDLNQLKFQESIPIIRFTRFNSDTLPFDLSNISCNSGRNIQIAFEWIGPQQMMIPEFRFRLKGKTDWSPWSELTIVSLPELSSGNYKLELETQWKKGMDPFANVSTLNFKVAQHFWEEPYFKQLIIGIVAALLLLLVYLFYRSRLHNQKYQHLELESKYHQARMLAAQLNPHFTSNFLNTVVKSIEFNDPQIAEDKIVQASAFLRKFLGSLRSKEKNGLIPLHDELEIVRIYLEMENVLHSGKLEWNIEMNDEFDPYEWLVPPMILQPYVENAIVWGIDAKVPMEGKISLKIREAANEIEIRIHDDGVGIEASQQSNGNLKRRPEESGTQIVHERLKLLKSLGIYIQCTVQSDSGGTQVLIVYPKIRS